MVSTISRGSTVFIASDWTVIEVLVCGVHKGGGLERAIVLSVVDAYVPVCLPLEVERALERGHGKKTHCDSVSAACQVLALTVVLIYLGGAKRTILSSRERENESRIPRGCYRYFDRYRELVTRELQQGNPGILSLGLRRRAISHGRENCRASLFIRKN